MSLKIAVKSLFTLIVSSVFIYSQNDNSGEKFISSNNECKSTTPAPLPSFVSKPEFKNGSMSVKISTPAGSDLKDVYYAVLLTADLTIPLDQAASTAGVDKGVAVCKQYSATSIGSDATINVSLDPKLTGTESKVLNERYYVAIAAYRCNWNARDNDGKLLRSGWKLWVDGISGVPQSISAAPTSEKEALFVKGYLMSNAQKMLYIRASSPSTDQSKLFLYSSSDSREETPLATFAFNSFNQSGTKTNRIDALSVGDAIEKANTQTVFDTLVIKEDVSTYHLFIKIADATAPAKLKVVENSGSIRKGSVSFQEYDLTNQFVDGISEYAYLEGSGITDPVTQGTLPASIPDNAKFLCLAMAQLNAAHAEYQTVGKNNKGLVGGYFQAFDEVVKKWETSIGILQSGLTRLKGIQQSVVMINNTTLMADFEMKYKGIFFEKGNSDTNRVAYYDCYSQTELLMQSDPANISYHTRGIGLVIEASKNVELFMLNNGSDEFNSILDGYSNQYSLLRLDDDVVGNIVDSGIWAKPIRVYDEKNDFLKEIYYDFLRVGLAHGAASGQFNYTTNGLRKSLPSPKEMYADLMSILKIKSVPENSSANKSTKTIAAKATDAQEKNSDLLIKMIMNDGEKETEISDLQEIISLPHQKWKITYNRQNEKIEFKIDGSGKSKIKSTVTGNSIELTPSESFINGEEATLKISEYKMALSRKKKSYKKVLNTIEKKIMVFRLGVKDLNNNNAYEMEGPTGTQCPLSINFSLPENIRNVGTVLLRRNSSLKLWAKNNSGEMERILPTNQIGFIRDWFYNGEGSSLLKFDLSKPDEYNKVVSYLKDCALETNNGKGVLEIVYKTANIKHEYLKETIFLNPADISIEPTIEELNKSPNFVTNLQLDIHAKLKSNKVKDPTFEWTFTPITNLPGHGRTVTALPETELLDKGRTLILKPRVIHTPGVYSKGSGGDPSQPSRPIAYKVDVKAAGTNIMSTFTLQQSIANTIRQEYVNHLPSGLTIKVPEVNEISDIAETEHFKKPVVNGLNSYAQYNKIVGNPLPIAEAVYNRVNEIIFDDQQLKPVGTSGLNPDDQVVGPGTNDINQFGFILTTTPEGDDVYDADTRYILVGPNGIAETRANHNHDGESVKIRVSSAWRSPERNENCKGVINSKHQIGGAMDMKIDPLPEDLTKEQCDCILQTAADEEGYKTIVEYKSTEIKNCNGKTENEEPVTHIHVQRK